MSLFLKLSTKAIFNKDVRPIELPQEDIDFLPESCFVSGWGRNNKETNYLSVTLMEVNVTLIDNENCTKSKSYCSEGEAGPAKVWFWYMISFLIPEVIVPELISALCLCVSRETRVAHWSVKMRKHTV